MIEMLQAALMQGDWKIRGVPAPGSSLLNTVTIINFRFEEVLILVLDLQYETEEKEVLKAQIKSVNLQGRFGTMHTEPREFTVSFHDTSGTLRQQALEGIGYWRVLASGDVGLAFIRDKNAPPGWPLHRNGSRAYGFEEHLNRLGSGENLLRTARVAQPIALQVGDILATGDRVLSPPRQGFNSSVLVHLTGGFDGHWIDVAPRLPIALLTQEDNAPPELWNRQ
jgi:hypothetical protein